jgi:methylphosphotriester-DNA--protein-cysteine methyltransferase
MKRHRLLNPQGEEYDSPVPGTLGGHRGLKIYGRLNCPNALRWLALGHYARHRVFFADEETAVAAGYRPCARCLPEQYRLWKQTQGLLSHDASILPSGE